MLGKKEKIKVELVLIYVINSLGKYALFQDVLMVRFVFSYDNNDEDDGDDDESVDAPCYYLLFPDKILIKFIN